MFFYHQRILDNKKEQAPLLDLSSIDTEVNGLELKSEVLKKIPDAVYELKHLEVLILSNQQISSIPADLPQQLPSLKRLVLHGNPLKKLPNIPGLDLDWWQYDLFHHQLTNDHIVGLRGANSRTEYLKGEIDFQGTEEDTFQYLEQFIPRLVNIGFPKLKYLCFHSYDYPIKRLPKEIAQLSELEELDLSHNKLEQLPDDFKKLKQLRRLYLSNNNFNAIPYQLLFLPNLELLDLAENLISHPQFKYPPGPGQKHIFQLKSLNLSSNGVIKLPKNFSNFVELECLILQNFRNHRQGLEIADRQFFKGQVSNPLTGLLDEKIGESIHQLKSPGNPISDLIKEKEDNSVEETLEKIWEEICQLPKLKQLDLSKNELGSIPQQWDKLRYLEQLDLSSNNLNQLPEGIQALEYLKSIKLNDNKLQEIPPQLFQLQYLEHLDLKNGFDGPPDQIAADWSSLPHLQELDLSHNGLSNGDFLSSLSHLKQLRILNIQHNNIQELPQLSDNFEALEQLFVNNNNIEQFPEQLVAFPKVKLLALNNNQINRLPEHFQGLEVLEILYLQNNSLEWLPEDICQLSQLKELHLNDNKLTGLPSSLQLLHQLEVLNLEKNFLRKLSNQISYLPKLQELNLQSCGLRKLGVEFFRRDQLDLQLGNNPLISPPTEIYRKGKTAILDYFEELERKKSDYLHEAKLLIVGSPGAGKTTLRLKLLDAHSPLPSAQDSTEGVDIEQMLFPMMDGKNFRINIWDFGGQELYHSTHQFFFTARSLYALVLNTRRDDDRIDYWLHTIQLFGGNSPIIIIQNQEKDRTYPLNEQRYRQQYPNIKEFVQLNLSNPNKVPQLLRKIQYHIQDLPHVGDELPQSWLEIREALGDIAKKEAYISLDDFWEICEEYDLREEHKIMLLSSYLHDLGTVLHFSDNPVLRNLLFLQNSWVIDAVYRVLDNNLVKNQQHGSFHLDDLDQIWSNPEYKRVKYELLELMLKFEVCFKLADKEQYIVPQLLSPNPPDFDFPKDNVLHIQYNYDFMPRGLLSRFIVQMHHYIKSPDLIWKEGVILDRLGSLAKITEDYDRGIMQIQIVGKEAKALLAILTDEFDRLHASYPQDLKVQKMIPCNCGSCKNSEQPQLYDYQKLQKYIENNRPKIVCDQSFQDVMIAPLLDGIQNPLLNTQNGKVEILFLAANPKNTQALELDKEVELLREVIESGKHQSSIEIDQRWEVSYDKLQQSILKMSPQIVHFSGHGLEKGLILEKADGKHEIADAKTLAGLFAPLKDEIVCVILNACYSEHQAKEIAAYIPFVVGMNTAISDKAAMLFTKGFYRGLSNRLDVEFAYNMGMNLVQSERPDQLDIFAFWKDGKPYQA
jgi:internalin A